MKAYKCDICGDYYDGYAPMRVGWKDYDICPKCARVVESLIMAGSKVKEEEKEEKDE